MMEMHRVAQQRHLAGLKQLLAVRSLFQRASHNGHPSERQNACRGRLGCNAAKLRIADECDALRLPLVRLHGGFYRHRPVLEAACALRGEILPEEIVRIIGNSPQTVGKKL